MNKPYSLNYISKDTLDEYVENLKQGKVAAPKFIGRYQRLLDVSIELDLIPLMIRTSEYNDVNSMAITWHFKEEQMEQWLAIEEHINSYSGQPANKFGMPAPHYQLRIERVVANNFYNLRGHLGIITQFPTYCRVISLDVNTAAPKITLEMITDGFEDYLNTVKSGKRLEAMKAEFIDE